MTSTASSPEFGAGEIRSSAPVGQSLTNALVFSAQGLLLVLAVVLFSRWLGGAFTRPVPGLAIVATTLAVSAFAALFRFRCSVQYPVRSTPPGRAALVGRIAMFAVPGLTTALILSSLAVARTSNFALIIAWLTFAAVEFASWFLFYQHARPRTSFSRGAASRASVLDPHGPDESPESLGANIFQQLTRSRAADGKETLSATVRIDIPAGDRVQVLHVAFCPPFERLPAIEIEQIEGPDAELRATTVQTFGTRIEARLTERAVAPQSLVLQVYGATGEVE